MRALKPKEQHEQMLAKADTEKIVQYLKDGADEDITKIAVTLARQCTLFVHFSRLWEMRVEDLEPRLSSERWMKNVYMNKNELYKELRA